MTTVNLTECYLFDNMEKDKDAPTLNKRSLGISSRTICVPEKSAELRFSPASLFKITTQSGR